MASFAVVQPTGKCLIASWGKWVIVSPDGHSVCLSGGAFRKYFVVRERIVKLQFSPKGKSVYAVGKFGTVQRLSLLHKELERESEF